MTVEFYIILINGDSHTFPLFLVAVNIDSKDE